MSNTQDGFERCDTRVGNCDVTFIKKSDEQHVRSIIFKQIEMPIIRMNNQLVLRAKDLKEALSDIDKRCGTMYFDFVQENFDDTCSIELSRKVWDENSNLKKAGSGSVGILLCNAKAFTEECINAFLESPDVAKQLKMLDKEVFTSQINALADAYFGADHLYKEAVEELARQKDLKEQIEKGKSEKQAQPVIPMPGMDLTDLVRVIGNGFNALSETIREQASFIQSSQNADEQLKRKAAQLSQENAELKNQNARLVSANQSFSSEISRLSGIINDYKSKYETEKNNVEVLREKLKKASNLKKSMEDIKKETTPKVPVIKRETTHEPETEQPVPLVDESSPEDLNEIKANDAEEDISMEELVASQIPEELENPPESKHVPRVEFKTWVADIMRYAEDHGVKVKNEKVRNDLLSRAYKLVGNEANLETAKGIYKVTMNQACPNTLNLVWFVEDFTPEQAGLLKKCIKKVIDTNPKFVTEAVKPTPSDYFIDKLQKLDEGIKKLAEATSSKAEEIRELFHDAVRENKSMNYSRLEEMYTSLNDVEEVKLEDVINLSDKIRNQAVAVFNHLVEELLAA